MERVDQWAKGGALAASALAAAAGVTSGRMAPLPAGAMVLGGVGDGGVPRAILLCNVFCAVKQPNRIVIQQAAIDEYFVGFSNCSEEKGNGHGASDGFRDQHVREVSRK